MFAISMDALTVSTGVLGRAYSEAKIADTLPPSVPPNGGISRFRPSLTQRPNTR
jgi:hypothetical protein